MKVGKLLVKYDEAEALESELEYRKEERKEELEAGELTQEELEHIVYAGDSLDFYWEDVKGLLDEILAKKNKEGYWKATVNNFGWRNLDGLKYFVADNATDFLQEILPKTDCTFKIFNYGKGLAIQNYHHDSPMGNEWYYIRPISYNAYEKVA